MVDGIADLDANYLDLHSPIIDIVVSNSFFLSTGTRLISDVAANPTDVAPQKTVGSIGSILGLTMIGNSLTTSSSSAASMLRTHELRLATATCQLLGWDSARATVVAAR